MKNKTYGLNSITLIIALKFNVVNTPIKSQRLSEWIKKARPNNFCYKRNTLNIQTEKS